MRTRTHVWIRTSVPSRLLLVAALGLILVSVALPNVGGNSGRALAAPAGPVVAPNVTFSTYLGGTSWDCTFGSCAVAVDAAGNIYLTGSTLSDDFPLVNPLYTAGSVYVTKIAAGGGSIIYSTYLGGGDAEAIVVDESGNAYVTGRTASDTFPTTPNAVQSQYRGGVDAFVTKLNADGSQLLYSTYLGGSGRDEGWDIGVDSSGSIYVTGWTRSTDFPTAQPMQAARRGPQDVFVTKINAGGDSFAYSTYLGGSEHDYVRALAVDNAGNAYVGGRTGSDDFPTTPGVVQPDPLGRDAFVAKLNASGSGLSYSTYLSGGLLSSDEVFDLAVDRWGSLHVTGLSYLNGVTKLSPDGSRIIFRTESVFWPQAEGIALDSAGNSYVVGNIGGGADTQFKLAVISAGGRMLYEQEYGGSSIDSAYGVALDASQQCRGQPIIVGQTSSGDFPTSSPLQPSLLGGKDMFVYRLSSFPTCRTFLPLATR